MAMVAIIQARMGSTRLPGKVLAALGGRPVLRWVVDAAAAIPGCDRVIVATTSAPADDVVAAWCVASGVGYFRGDEDDVLSRFAGAAHAAKAEVVIRVTADCPLLDPEEAGKVLSAVMSGEFDYASNNDPPTYPDGLDCEAFTRIALDDADRLARRPSEREHVTPYMRSPRSGLRIARIGCPAGDLGAERWTLDTPEDLEFLRSVVEDLPRGRPPRLSEVLGVIDRRPELRHLNLGVARNEGLARSLERDRAAGF
jgi:glutamate-1-semialdehyde 2,1-aminomutase/spore coat polysaccharide biosynthesis protein SpsF